MPPVPVTFSEEASRLISAAKRRQTDIIEFQIPQLHACKGPLSLQQNLAADLREDIGLFARQVEALDTYIDDQIGERNRTGLRRVVGELQDGLAQARRDSRAALLTSKRVIDAQSKSQKEELLASSAVTGKQNSDEKVTDDALMKANDDVTEALRRTIGLMQGELERSVLSVQMLDASTASLRATSTTHDTLTNVMGVSKQLITALEKSDWVDRVLIISAFIFFVLVALFIIKQRIFDRTFRLAFWWTRFLPGLPDFSLDEALLQPEKPSLDASSILVSLSSAVLTASSSAATVAASLVPSPFSEKNINPTNTDSSTMVEDLHSEASLASTSFIPVSSSFEGALGGQHPVVDEL